MPAAYPNVWHLEARFRDNARINALPQLFNVLRGDIRITDTSLFD